MFSIKKIKERIISLIVILVMLAMIFGKLIFFNTQTVWAATQANTTLELIISGAGRGITVPDKISFKENKNLNTFSSTQLVMSNLVVWDLQGQATGWSLTTIVNSQTPIPLNVSAVDGLFSLGFADISGITLGGSIGNFNDGIMSIANAASDGGRGNFMIGNIILGASLPDSYQNTLTVTMQ